MAKAQEVKDLAMSGLAQAIDDEKKEQWRAEGRSMLFDAKRVKNNFFFSLPWNPAANLAPFYVQYIQITTQSHLQSCRAWLPDRAGVNTHTLHKIFL